MNPLTIVAIVVFVVLLFVIWKYLLSDPYTLQGLQSGQTTSTISASSLETNGTGVPSSNFAYSVWFYVNDWNYRYGEPKVIFGRMGAKSADGKGSIDGIDGLNPCPAVVLGAAENNVAISLACFPGVDAESEVTTEGNSIIHTCGVTNVPIQRWVNLVISVYGRTLDIYIDGKLVRTCLLPGIASVNSNSDIYVTPSGGFDGWTAKLQYFPNSLNPQDAWNIYSKGYTSWATMFNSYQVEVSLVQNGTTTSSVTI